MSNIGYAVFGSPKGIAVISNGIFKELNLDKSLYLNNSQIILEPKEQVLLIRRIPSNLKNLDKKDGLLIALYEHALQHGENRSGGFVGSAICFKDYMPNAEKMISGLLYLFKKIKENVDENNRFKAIDSSSWNISLPDPNKEFGMFEKNNLKYAPFSNSKVNYAIKTNNFEKESVALLTSVCLNYSYHNANYIYASNSNNVIEKLIHSGLINLEYSSLFNYSKHLTHFSSKIDRDNVKLKNLKTEFSKLNDGILTKNNELEKLINELTLKKDKIINIDKEIIQENETLKKIKTKKQNQKLELKELEKLVIKKSPYKNKDSQKNDKKVKEYQQLITTVVNCIDDYTNVKFNNVKGIDIEEQNKSKVTYYFEKLPERKKKNKLRKIIIISLLLAAILTFLGLFLYTNYELSMSKEKVHDYEQRQLEITTANQEKNNIKKQLFDNIKNFKKESDKADVSEFKKHTKTFLTNFLNGEYNKESKEVQFIQNYNWEFWELDYTNKKLTQKLNLNYIGGEYFVNLEKELKPLTRSFQWEGETKINEILNKYLEESNDIYENIDKQILKDSLKLMTHFKWLIEKNNGKLENLKVKTKLKLPFFNN